MDGLQATSEARVNEMSSLITLYIIPATSVAKSMSVHRYILSNVRSQPRRCNDFAPLKVQVGDRIIAVNTEGSGIPRIQLRAVFTPSINGAERMWPRNSAHEAPSVAV